MTDEDKLDLSPLDPWRDAATWERTISKTITRVVQRRKPSVMREIARRGVFVFALAAAAAAAMWFGRRPGTSTPHVARDPVTEWTRWASGEPVDPLSLVDNGGAR